jgi:hypothetical protein
MNERGIGRYRVLGVVVETGIRLGEFETALLAIKNQIAQEKEWRASDFDESDYDESLYFSPA